MSSIDMCEHDWPGSGCKECFPEKHIGYWTPKKLMEIGLPNVEMVSRSDYDALAQQLAATQEDRKEWIADVDRLENEARVLRQKLAASQVEVGNLKDAQATITRLEATLESEQKYFRKTMKERLAEIPKLHNQLAEAVGLLRENEWQYTPYDDHYHKPAGHRCPECGGYRESGHQGKCEVGAYLAAHEEKEND